MRPVPRSRHHLAVLLLAAAATFSAYSAMMDNRLSDLQVQTATSLLKRNQPSLYPHDPVYGASKLWLTHSPAFQAALEMVAVPTAMADTALPYQILTPILAMIYLCGMYALLYRQCRSWSISVFVAVLSSTVIHSPGGTFWGVGSLQTASPPGMLLAVTPLVVLAYLQYAGRAQVMLVFAFVGLMGNVHLPSAANLTIILLIAHLARGRFRPACLLTGAGGALAAMLGGLPYASYTLALRSTIGEGGFVPYAAARAALERAQVLYPELLGGLLNWLLLAGLLLIPAAAVLIRVERFRIRDIGFWVYFACAGVFVAMGLQGGSQLVGLVRNEPPPVIDFVQALSLVLLPLYVLLAQALTNLFRIVRQNRHVLRWVCAAILAAWMLPSDNLRVARHALLDTATMYMDETDKPRSIRRQHQRASRRAELAGIAAWASDERNTPPDGVFITDLASFRLAARRGVVTCPEDRQYIYRYMPARLPEWNQRVNRQARLLHPTQSLSTDPEEVFRFVRDLSEGDFRTAGGWWLILDARIAPQQPGRLREIPSDLWGRHYRLYRVR